jgi:hypothetical protein
MNTALRGQSQSEGLVGLLPSYTSARALDPTLTLAHRLVEFA